MTNFWRDFDLTDRFGIYGGGGFGDGGYRCETVGAPFPGLTINGQSAVTTFAWQVGTGLTYQFSEKITFDVGHRFFALGPRYAPTSANVALGPTSWPSRSAASRLPSLRVNCSSRCGSTSLSATGSETASPSAVVMWMIEESLQTPTRPADRGRRSSRGTHRPKRRRGRAVGRTIPSSFTVFQR